MTGPNKSPCSSDVSAQTDEVGDAQVATESQTGTGRIRSRRDPHAEPSIWPGWSVE